VDNKKYLERFARRIGEKAPKGLKAVQNFAAHFADPWKPVKYYLHKVNNKKLGFVYYVRYFEKGKMIPSSWCTHTNDENAAKIFAVENRDRLINKYYNRAAERKPYFDLYSILKKYYSENSPYLQADKDNGREICEHSRITYNNFINKQFIPFLRKERVNGIEQIDTPLLWRFQKQLRSGIIKKNGTVERKGIKPQTINHYISYISLIFDHLITEGRIKTNPCKSLKSLKIGKNDLKITGCYEVGKLKGVFNRRWKDELSYLLSLIIYTTDMRNSEIERIQVKDFFMIDDVHFLDIPESKSVNGVRIVPIHNFVYRKITAYMRKNKIEDYLFRLPNCKKLGSKRYKSAYTELAGYTGYTAEQLEVENIKFYSGRHFWKTLMNSENLGDVEEYFMGHKVSGDVAKRYNHRDKQGKKKLLEKTRKVFQILDKYVFNAK